jgi:hypothetical protein
MEKAIGKPTKNYFFDIFFSHPLSPFPYPFIPLSPPLLSTTFPSQPPDMYVLCSALFCLFEVYLMTHLQ